MVEKQKKLKTFLTNERKNILFEQAKLCSSLEGNIAEFGVAYGEISVELAKKYPNKMIYSFDTFEGFKTIPEEYFNASPQFDVKIYKIKYNQDYEWDPEWGIDFPWEDILKNLEKYNNILIKKGLFPSTTVGLENEKYCFAHIDVDIYSSTLLGLQYFYPRLTSGGVIVIDDFHLDPNHFPGVRQAIENFFNTKAENVVEVKAHGQGIIQKLSL